MITLKELVKLIRYTDFELYIEDDSLYLSFDDYDSETIPEKYLSMKVGWIRSYCYDGGYPTIEIHLVKDDDIV